MTKQTNVRHICMERFHEIMFCAITEHVEGFSPGEIAHYVERVEVEPISYIDGFIGSGGEMGEELGGVGCYAWFVVSEGWRWLAIQYYCW